MPLRYAALRLVRHVRGGEATLIVLAIGVGIGAGLLTVVQGALAHGLQHLFFGVNINRLSALGSIRHPWRLLALPLGGLVLIAVNRIARLKQAPVDVVEANALHGGRIPLRDSLWVMLQTILSNGFGASVGLEAAYSQAGGGLGSLAGQALRLRRGDLRMLVGAGAGAAIAAAFGAPLTGAFYAFEVVIGAYTPAAIAPVAAAALAAALVSRALGAEPYLLVVPVSDVLTTHDYLLFAGLGLVCAAAGIALMQAQAGMERLVTRLPLPATWRPLLGGLLLVPLALASPQALSSGHGALRLDLALQPAASFLLFVFAVKALASLVSLSCGFRGGLFFASLFLGSLLGPVYAHAVNALAGHPVLGDLDAALVGMAAFAVTVVGGPMTMALLVLEATGNFAITGVVIAAVLCASAFTRARFGYSFSTWRLHLRGAAVRSARDIGWAASLTAARLMRRDARTVDADATIAGFRAKVPLGATSRAILVDGGGCYRGIVATAQAWDAALDPQSPVATLATLSEHAVAPDVPISDVLDRFERLGADDLAVADGEGRVLGVLTEKYVNRRYIEESEKYQSQLFGE
ncbi:MAG: chloride channel protein [Sphingomonadales bacterium]|nr:chloride channel protein [Sphingomonadales bacterium]